MWNDLPVPIIIAHRGDKKNAPENTIAAFLQAAEKGADAVEFDVKLSSDEQVIVLHDQRVDRTTTGKGRATNLSLAALQELDAGIKFPGKFPGEKIPSLIQVFETVGRRIHMNIELTNYSTPFDPLVQKVVKLVKNFGIQDQVLFSSFLPSNLNKARILLPEVPRALLTLRGWKGSWGRGFGWRGKYAALNPYFTDITPGLVSRIHGAGKRVYGWTVTAEMDIKRMIDLGVDGIITGDLAVALNLVGRSK
jgi:glycerophosphoryl diester phosphodiesterase